MPLFGWPMTGEQEPLFKPNVVAIQLVPRPSHLSIAPKSSEFRSRPESLFFSRNL